MELDKIKLIFRLLPVLFLSACAAKAVVWQKPNTSTDEQRADLAQCRSYSASEADRDYLKGQRNSGNSDYGEQSTYQQNMAAYQVKKSGVNLLARCMKLKGYRQAAR